MSAHLPVRPLLLGLMLILVLSACQPAPTALPSAVTPAVNTPAPTAQPTPPPPEPTQAAPEPTQPEPVQPEPTQPAPPADPAALTWREVVSGLNKPVDLTYAPGEEQRVYVVEQAGVIRIIENGALLAEPFLDLRSRVGSQGNEQGLLGLAFHPQYAQNGWLYVNYTDRQGNSVVARFTRSGASSQADPESEAVLLRVEQPYGNHNGGGVVFGPDGFLYLSFGDGGSANDPLGAGQSTDTLLGKILRVDVSAGQGSTIPADNPFAAGGGRAEIWAWGLRNPWRFSFDRLTGDVYIADVGQNQYEEINFWPAGSPPNANFGWDLREASHPFEGSVPAGLQLTDPVWEYDHSQGCSVTGGYVYRGPALPEWQGAYIFGDYCSGLIWGLKQTDGSWQTQPLFDTDANISAFGLDAQGELYLLDHRTGRVLRLERAR